MWLRIFFAALCATFFLGTPLSYAEGPVFQSGPDRTTLLELYTAEGCPTCPSADEWVSGLKSSHDLWQKVVPVAFHVDTWNASGQKDVLSAQAFGNLQRAHARRWGRASAYTPMFVKNGKEYRDWFTQERVPRNFRKKTGMLTVEPMAAGQWKVTYQPQPSRDLKADYHVHAALLGFDIKSRVTAGENTGRELTHDFAVLELRHSRLSREENRFEGIVVLKKNAPVPVKQRGLAVWVTGAREEMLQSTGGYLPEEK